jgi:uncharacterized RDD family membrane protein YckC
MMKRGFAVALIVLLFVLPLVLQIAVAAEIPGVPLGLSPEELTAKAEALSKLKEQSYWQYLGVRFQESLMKNPVIALIDGFFTKISFVSLILFGMPYSLSLTLLFVIFLWFYFLMLFYSIFSTFSGFSEQTFLGIDAFICIILAQMQIFRKIVEGIGWLLFARKGWVWSVSMTIIVILAFILIYKFSGNIWKWLKGAKARREEMKKKSEERVREIIQKAGTEAIQEAWSYNKGEDAT